MENAYDLGQRVERLLYMSVVVIAFSFIVLSLSKSLAISQEVNKTLSYKNIISALKKNESGLKIIREYNEKYSKFLADEKKRKDEYDKDLADKDRVASLNEENLVRSKLGLPGLPIELKKVEPSNYIGYDYQLNEVNKTRNANGLPKLANLNEANGTENEIIIEIIKRESSSSAISEPLLGVLKEYNYNIDRFTQHLESEIKKSQSAKIKILDVDTPVSFPLSIGDMKLNIPMENIENWSLTIMPIFLVIWIGAIFITRCFEIIKILESKQVINFYPHILNLFSINSKNHSSNDVKNKITLAFGGDVKAISHFRLESIVFALFRILLVTTLIIAMAAPTYYGFFIYLESDNSKKIYLYYLCIIIPAFINLMQLGSCIITELKTLKKSFILDGGNSEIL